MKKLMYFLFVALISLSFSCSSDDDEGDGGLTKNGPFAISELAGTWDVTKAQFSANTNSVDVIAEGGTATMTVQSSGRFSLTIDPTDREAFTVTGELFWEEWQQSFYFAIVWDEDRSDWDTYGHTYDGNTLSINGGPDSGEYDFNNDGNFEPCSVHFVFVRS